MSVEIAIEKLVYGGEGLGHLPPDEAGRGKAVFVPFVLPGERVEVELASQRPGFSRAELRGVVTPSELRVAPQCEHFGRCGGCQYQHASYAAQLGAKAEILRETLHRTAKITLDVPLETHSAEPWHYRNRTRMKIHARSGFALGYFRAGSHELEAVRECPISSPLINRAIAAMWAAGENGLAPESLGEVQFFAAESDQGSPELLIEIYVREGSDPTQFEPLSVALGESLPELAGVAVFFGASVDDDSERPSKRPVAAGAFGEASITYRTTGANFQVSAGSFFQTNRYLVDVMQELVTKGRKGAAALDLYSGVGLFSVPLARSFDHVTAVEVSPYSFADLEHNAPANLTPVLKSTEEYLRQAKRSEFDFVVVDPPRAGLNAEIVRALGRLEAPTLTYVSCDPATLSRDLALLIKSGFRVEQAHLLDLFPQTFHIESIFHLAR